VKSTSYEAPHYAVFSNLMSLHLEILRAVSNTGIYCSSEKVGIVAEKKDRRSSAASTQKDQHAYYNTFSKIPPSSMQFATRVRTWRVARLYSILYSEIALSRKPFGIGHMYIHAFLLRMADTVTFPPGASYIASNDTVTG
jgi:hypothetical protein